MAVAYIQNYIIVFKYNFNYTKHYRVDDAVE